MAKRKHEEPTKSKKTKNKKIILKHDSFASDTLFIFNTKHVTFKNSLNFLYNIYRVYVYNVGTYNLVPTV